MTSIRLLPRAGVIAALTLLGLRAAAMDNIEAPFETSTRQVPVPATHYDTLLLANCSTCPQVTVQVTPQTQFFIGDEEVSLADLRAYTSVRPPLISCIYYSTPGRKVNRFVVARMEPLDDATTARKLRPTSKRKD